MIGDRHRGVNGVCGGHEVRLTKDKSPSRQPGPSVYADTLLAWHTELGRLGGYGLSDQEANSRATAVEALIIGTVVTKRLLPAQVDIDPEPLIAWLANSLQCLIDGPTLDPEV